MFRNLNKLFLLFILFLFLFHCKDYEKRNDAANIQKDQIDEKYFLVSRIKKGFENDIHEKAPLNVQSIEIIKNNSVRLLFNYPVFFEEEIGRSSERSFLFFDPFIKGEFISRTNRIVDFLPESVSKDEHKLIIPKDLTGIEGNILRDEFSIDISFYAKNNGPIDFSIDGEEKIIEKDNRSKNRNIKLGFKTSSVELISSVDLENPHDNNFGYINVHSIQRYYKKIKKEDVPFLIKNIKYPERLKEYFLKKKLSSLKEIANIKKNSFKSSQYIPEKEKGIYFCFQKVTFDKGDVKEYFQIYNFSTNKIIGFDTEKSIIIYSNQLSGENGNNKLSVYSLSGELIKSGSVDGMGFIVCQNEQYSEVFAFLDPGGEGFYKIVLNEIEKRDYNIYANFDKSGSDLIEVHGILRDRNGRPVNNISEVRMDMKISKNKKNLFYRQISQIGEDGSFSVSFKRSIVDQKDHELSFVVNNKTVKKYSLNISNDNFLFFEDKFILNYDPLSLIEDVVFLNKQARFVVNEKVIKRIDSIYYVVKNNNIKSEENNYQGNLRNGVKVPIPSHPGEYNISFEIILKDGDSISQDFLIRKIDKIYNNEKLIVNGNDRNSEKGDKHIYFYNPFEDFNAVLILYNNDIRHKRILKLKKGYNTVIVDKEDIVAPNLRSLIILYDLIGNNLLCYSNEIFDLENLIKKTEIKITKKNDGNDGRFDIETNINPGEYKGKEIYLQFSPLHKKTIDPIFHSLFSYNDFINSKERIEKIEQGKRIKINENFKNIININSPKEYSFRLNISILKNELTTVINADINVTIMGITDLFCA